MSDENQNEESFDFDFDLLNADAPQEGTGESAFDLDNPFGDDMVVSYSDAVNPPAKSGESDFDLDNPFGDDMVVSHSETAAPSVSSGESSFDLDNPFEDDMVVSHSETANPPVSSEKNSFDMSDFAGDDLATFDGAVSADNPYFDDSATGDAVAGISSPINLEKSDKKKKKGWFSKDKDAPKKEKATREKVKKEKASKKSEPAGEPVPRDWGMILCIAFSLFLLASLLLFDIVAFLLPRGEGSTIVHTLCFLGAFNLVGLVAAAVPILFYKFPNERTLPNVMLGISSVALTGTVLIAVTEFYRYSFILKP
ncbi:MAG: hypothetical protein LBI05_10480 [Planctomycetaceae bacterium]|jgi:hypothetical protein|nr:hypothetical protein [Planctomycetaceae bacterium]